MRYVKWFRCVKLFNCEPGVSLVFQARELVIRVGQTVEMLRWAGLSGGKAESRGSGVSGS